MATTTEVGVKITVDGSEATKSVGSIKSQLKEATAELIAMREKFGDTSDEAVKAAKKVANLKDSIGDAKAMADAFNPDAKFKAFGTALQGVAGGFSAVQGAMGLVGGESKQVEAMLLKVNSAMALSQGVNSILEAKDGFKNLKSVAIDAFKGIKTAIGSTGIGLLVVALGTIYAYWDDIKEAVGGVSDEQSKLNQASADNLKIQQQKLDAIGSQDNILKLQGKSERDILKIKINQTDETITAGEANIQNLKATKVEQVRIAERNKEILKGLLNFLSVPITAVLFAVDKIRSTMGQTSTLLEDYKNGLANLVFNPEKVADEADSAIAEAEKGIANLKNQRAGYQLQIQSIDKQASDKKKETDDANKAKELEAQDKYQKDLQALKDKNFTEAIKDENDKAGALLNLQFTNDIKALNASKLSEEQKNAMRIELGKQYDIQLDAINAKRDADAKVKTDKEEADANAKRDKEIAFEEGTFKILNDLRISQIKSETDKARELEALRYQADIDANIEALNKKEISQADFDARAEANKKLNESKISDIQKTESENRIKQDELERKTKIDSAKAIGDSLGALSDLVGKQTAVGKAMGIAQALINTYIGASEVLRAKSVLPEPIGTITKVINVATIIATGIKSVKAIIGTKVPNAGGGGGGGSVSAPSIPAITPPLPPQLNTQMINGGQINQLASATARAYVVESDVSGNQERINRLNRASRIN